MLYNSRKNVLQDQDLENNVNVDLKKSTFLLRTFLFLVWEIYQYILGANEN